MYPIDIPIAEMNNFDLPKMCLITGDTAAVEFKKVKFAWYPRWILIFVFVALIVALILSLILTKRAAGELPFNAKAYRNWRIGQGVFAFSVLIAIFTFVGAIVAFLAGEGTSTSVATGIALSIFTFGFPFGIWFALVRNKSITVKKIDPTTLTLMVPKMEVAMAFKKHLTGGKRTAGIVASGGAAPTSSLVA